MNGKIYLVGTVDVKTDTLIESTLHAFSSRTKQIEYVNYLKCSHAYIAGKTAIMTRVILMNTWGHEQTTGKHISN